MTVGQAVSTQDCVIHEMDAEDQTQARLESVQQATTGEYKPTYIAWNIGPNLTAEEREEMLALQRVFRDAFAADMPELGDSAIALHTYLYCSSSTCTLTKYCRTPTKSSTRS